MNIVTYAGVFASVMRFCSDLALELGIASENVRNYDSMGDMSALGDGDTCGFNGLTMTPAEGTTQFYVNVRIGFTTTLNDNHHRLELVLINALMSRMVPNGTIPLYDLESYQVIGSLASSGEWATLPAQSVKGISFKLVQFHLLADCLLNASAQSLGNAG
jgi:hypothetical protein